MTWQDNLYPVTYQFDPIAIERTREELLRNLEIERRTLAWATKARQPSLVRSLRRNVDRQARWVRNCETQLRLIEADPFKRGV